MAAVSYDLLDLTSIAKDLDRHFPQHAIRKRTEAETKVLHKLTRLLQLMLLALIYVSNVDSLNDSLVQD